MLPAATLPTRCASSPVRWACSPRSPRARAVTCSRAPPTSHSRKAADWYCASEIRPSAASTWKTCCARNRLGRHMPAIPSFYHQPRTIDDLVTQYVCRVLAQLGLPQIGDSPGKARPAVAQGLRSKPQRTVRSPGTNPFSTSRREPNRLRTVLEMINFQTTLSILSENTPKSRIFIGLSNDSELPTVAMLCHDFRTFEFIRIHRQQSWPGSKRRAFGLVWLRLTLSQPLHPPVDPKNSNSQ